MSPVPDTDVIELCSDDVCLVLASDGLTNVIRPQYAVDIVNTHEWRELQEERGIQAQLLVRCCLYLIKLGYFSESSMACESCTLVVTTCTKGLGHVTCRQCDRYFGNI